jgi:hypothetical protein
MGLAFVDDTRYEKPESQFNKKGDVNNLSAYLG